MVWVSYEHGKLAVITMEILRDRMQRMISNGAESVSVVRS
jgi:hypothetical protein